MQGNQKEQETIIYAQHIAAVLIKYARDRKEVIEASKDVFTKKFIGRLKNSILDDEISGKPLNIEVKYEFSSCKVLKKSSIELKIGEDKLYIVKGYRTIFEGSY